MRRARWLAPAALAMALAGCPGDPEARREIEVDPAQLCASLDPESGIWESTPWSDPACPWLEYPGQAALQIPHDLGRVPRVVLPYIAFDEDGMDGTLASGNTTVVWEVTDTTVTVANNTEETFFLRLVLQ
ncbi:MAG: hypothetical protein ACODAU_05090 [Myxococcota bacterium]